MPAPCAALRDLPGQGHRTQLKEASGGAPIYLYVPPKIHGTGGSWCTRLNTKHCHAKQIQNSGIPWLSREAVSAKFWNCFASLSITAASSGWKLWNLLSNTAILKFSALNPATGPVMRQRSNMLASTSSRGPNFWNCLSITTFRVSWFGNFGIC